MLEYNIAHESQRKILIGLVLVLCVLVAYFQVNTLAFVHYDDEMYVTANPTVQAGINLNGIIYAFRTFDASNWHPITWISHMLDCELYGLNPQGHHWTNLQFHILNTVLLFIWLQWMTGALWRSAMVAALFGLHPLHVESVAWVAERKDVLSTFFGILTLLSYHRYVHRPGLLRYMLVVVCFSLGLMAKPMLITFPFLLLLLDIWPLKRTHLAQWPSSKEKVTAVRVLRTPALIIEKIPFILLSIGSGLLTYMAQQQGGAIRTFGMIPLKDRLGNAIISYMSYLIKMIWPYPLAVFYSYTPSEMLIEKAVVSGLFIISISVIAVLSLKKYPYIGVGWFWYIGTLLPVIGIIQVGSQGMADRYTYIPIIGLFIMLSWGANDILRNKRWRKPVYAVSTCLILSVLMVCTYFQVRHWKNSFSLFTHAVNATQNNWLAHHNLGVALDLAGNPEESIVHLQKALSIKPDFVDAMCNLGIAFEHQGDVNQALAYYEKALSIDSNHASSHMNMGRVLASKGETGAATSHFKRALQNDPTSADAHYNLGVMLKNQNRGDEAIRHFEKALALNPGFIDAHYNLGTLLLEHSKEKEGRRHIAQALTMIGDADPRTISPTYAEVFCKFGMEYSRHGQYQQAVAFLKKALEIDPGNQVARKNMNALTEALSHQQRQDSIDTPS